MHLFYKAFCLVVSLALCRRSRRPCYPPVRALLLQDAVLMPQLSHSNLETVSRV